MIKMFSVYALYAHFFHRGCVTFALSMTDGGDNSGKKYVRVFIGFTWPPSSLTAFQRPVDALAAFSFSRQLNRNVEAPWKAKLALRRLHARIVHMSWRVWPVRALSAKEPLIYNVLQGGPASRRRVVYHKHGSRFGDAFGGQRQIGKNLGATVRSDISAVLLFFFRRDGAAYFPMDQPKSAIAVQTTH